MRFIRRYWQWIFVCVISLTVCWPLFAPGYFSHHDDLQVLRVHEMRMCFNDLQLPCRWSENLGFGNGFPIFNYYGVLPYYVGGAASYLIGYVYSAKLLFVIGAFGAGISMWLLSRELYGEKGAAVATALYVYAPYRALDVYVRGDVTEIWSMMLAPLVMYAIFKLSQENRGRWMLVFSLSMAGLLMCNNILTMLYLPLLGIWSIWCVWGKSAALKRVLIGGLIGGMISGFFLLPAFFEKSLIQSEKLTQFDLDFRVHFATLNQIFFSRFWGYGSSVAGPNDGISIQIGWPHWWLGVMAVIAIFWQVMTKRSLKSRMNALVFGLALVFGFGVFMMHNRSAFIWERINLLEYAQFPWRFLAIVILATSLLGGSFICLVSKKVRYLWIPIVLLTIVLNISYFHPDKLYFDTNDMNKLAGSEWDRQTSSIILDYLPKTASEPREKAPSNPIITRGQAVVSDYVAKSNSFSFQLNTTSVAQVELPIFYFPEWVVDANGKRLEVSHNNLLGRISFEVGAGQYTIKGYFQNTSIRTLANVISIFGWISLLIYFIYEKNKRISF